jgi:hypothetical protein
MILGRSLGKYQSFCCHNALHGIRGCTNRGYKSARIIDEAVLAAVKATLFDDGFIADLTATVNARLAKLARGRRIATSLPPRCGIRFTQARPPSRQRRPAPLSRSFPSSTTAGRPHESRGKPIKGVDYVRKSPARIILENHLHALLF